MAEPVLKWAGGKRQILHEIRGCFPPESKVGAYHEPFFGGGALFFKTGPHTEGSTINDINSRLMNFYSVVQQKPDKLIQELESFRGPNEQPNPSRQVGKDEENYYYQQREIFNNRPKGRDWDEIEEAALLMYLNRTCYNGLYRENQSGEFNVPIGSHKNPNWSQAARIRAASRVLQGTTILDEDFEYIRDYAVTGDLVYFDPPYRPVSDTSSFVEYSSESFGTDEQKRLRNLVHGLHRKGVYVVVSNSPPIRELYDHIDGIYIEEIGAKRMINSNGDDRGEVGEIIITNVPEGERRERTPDIEGYAQESSST